MAGSSLEHVGIRDEEKVVPSPVDRKTQSDLTHRMRSAVFALTTAAAVLAGAERVRAEDPPAAPTDRITEKIAAPKEVKDVAEKTVKNLLSLLKEGDATPLENADWLKVFADLKKDPVLKKELTDALLPIFANTAVPAEQGRGARIIMRKLELKNELIGQPAADATAFVWKTRWGAPPEPESYISYIQTFQEGCMKNSNLELPVGCELSKSLASWMKGDGMVFFHLLNNIDDTYGLGEAKKDCINSLLAHEKRALPSLIYLLCDPTQMNQDSRDYLEQQCAAQGLRVKFKKQFLEDVLDDPQSPLEAKSMAVDRLLTKVDEKERVVLLIRSMQWSGKAVNLLRDYFSEHPEVSMEPFIEAACGGERSLNERERLLWSLGLTFGDRKPGPDNLKATQGLSKYLTESKMPAENKKSLPDDEKEKYVDVRMRALTALGSAGGRISKEDSAGRDERKKATALLTDEIENAQDDRIIINSLSALGCFGADTEDPLPILEKAFTKGKKHNVASQTFETAYVIGGMKTLRAWHEKHPGLGLFAAYTASHHAGKDKDAYKLIEELYQAREGDPLYNEYAQDAARGLLGKTKEESEKRASR